MSLKLLASCALALLAMTPGSAGAAIPHVVGRIPLHDGGWDILTVDPATGRVFIGRSDGVDMVDPKSRAVTPHFVGGTGFHAVTIVPGTPFVVASEKAGTVLVFDRATGRITGQAPSDPDADAMIYEPSSRTIWVMNGDSGTITIVDPVTARATGKIAVGGSLEFPALDGRGHLFVNIEDKAELAEIDIANRKVMIGSGYAAVVAVFSRSCVEVVTIRLTLANTAREAFSHGTTDCDARGAGTCG